MIDLGKHTLHVLGAYGISLALLAALVLASLHRARKAKAALRTAEETQGQPHV